jgi:peptidoglycan/LPS O-acetylase OafA/YrhL
MAVSVVISAIALVLRFYLRTHAPAVQLSHNLIYWSTYTRCDTLLIGAWLALFLRGNELSLSQLRRSSAALFWVAVAGLAFGAYHWRGYSIMHGPFMETAGYTLTALAAMGVLLRSLDDDSLLSKMLRFRPLSGLGVISYGFYFYHAIPSYPWHHLAEVHPALTNVIPLMAFAVTAAIAWLSFRYFESPFLRLKSELAPQRRAVPGGGIRTRISEPQPADHL